MSISSSSKGSSARTSSRTLRARSQRWQSSAWYRVTLRIDTARDRCFGDALDGKAVGRKSHRYAAALVGGPGLVERARHDVVQLRIHLGLLPEVLLEALHPLEVRDHDASGIREDVGKHEHAFVLENLVGGRRDGAVCALDDDFRLHARCVLVG